MKREIEDTKTYKAKTREEVRKIIARYRTGRKLYICADSKVMVEGDDTYVSTHGLIPVSFNTLIEIFKSKYSMFSEIDRLAEKYPDAHIRVSIHSSSIFVG